VPLRHRRDDGRVLDRGMRCFAWIELAVQALQVVSECVQRDQVEEKRASDNGHHETEKKETERGTVGYTMELEMTAPLPPKCMIEPQIDGKSKGQDELSKTVIEVWTEEKPWIEKRQRVHRDSLQQPLIEKEFSIRSISSDNQSVRRSNKPIKPISIPKERLHDSSLAYHYNPAVVAYVSSGRTTQPKTLKRHQRNSSSATFLNSPLSPVQIIVTTPEEESEPDTPIGNTFNAIRARRTGSNTSDTTTPSVPRGHAHSASTDSDFTPDRSRLMPPSEQIDHRRLRKAQEFREVRKFLIDFLNTKGDQFPKKLRSRIMDMYSISESHLDPAVVEEFAILDSQEGNGDEGVALEVGGDGSDADDLKILEMAFRSQIPIVTPTQFDTNPLKSKPDSVFLNQGSAGNRKRAGTQPEVSKRLTADETPRSWFGAITFDRTTSSNPIEGGSLPPLHGQVQSRMHRLLKTTSEPNLKRQPEQGDVPPLPILPKAALARGRNNTITGGALGRDKFYSKQMLIVDAKEKLALEKRSIFSDALGAFKQTLERSAKLREKKRFMKELQ